MVAVVMVAVVMMAVAYFVVYKRCKAANNRKKVENGEVTRNLNNITSSIQRIFIVCTSRFA